MSSRSEVNDDPLAIIHLYLAGMDPHGSPPRLIYESFRSYFRPDDILFFELEFDAGTPTKEADHQLKMASLVERLRCAQFARVLLFISTHSEEDRGDLFLGHCDHAGREGPMADEVTKFFETILCGGITPFLDSSTVVLLTSGWVAKFEDSFTSLQTALLRLPIHDCIAFATPRFQPPLANIFLLALFQSKIIQLIDFSSSFPRALERDSELGAHTDIIHFSFDRSSSPPIVSMTCDKYVWWNTNMRPYGNNIPFLCPTCASVRPWGKITKGEGTWSIQCSNSACGLNTDQSRFKPRAEIVVEKPANMTFVTPTNRRTNGWIQFRVVDVKV